MLFHVSVISSLLLGLEHILFISELWSYGLKISVYVESSYPGRISRAQFLQPMFPNRQRLCTNLSQIWHLLYFLPKIFWQQWQFVFLIVSIMFISVEITLSSSIRGNKSSIQFEQVQKF